MIDSFMIPVYTSRQERRLGRSLLLHFRMKWQRQMAGFSWARWGEIHIGPPMLRKSPGDYGAVILVHVLRDHSFLFSLDSCGAVGALLLLYY